MKTLKITATTKSGKSINVLHTCQIIDRGDRAGFQGLNRYTVEITSTVANSQVEMSIIDDKVYLTLTKKQVLDILGVSVKGDNNHIAADISVADFQEWNRNALKEVQSESKELAMQTERTAILKEAQEELENGVQEIQQENTEKAIYTHTPEFMNNGIITPIIEVGENCILSYDYMGSTIRTKVPEPGFYSQNGTKQSDVVYYDLGDSYVPLLREHAKWLATEDKNEIKHGGCPIGTGEYLEIPGVDI